MGQDSPASAETMKTEIKLPGITFTRSLNGAAANAKVEDGTLTLDNKSWQLIRLFKNDYPAAIWVGISTQSPLGEGTSAVFEDVSLTEQSISDFRLGI